MRAGTSVCLPVLFNQPFWTFLFMSKQADLIISINSCASIVFSRLSKFELISLSVFVIWKLVWRKWCLLNCCCFCFRHYSHEFEMLMYDMLNAICWSYLLFIWESELCCIHNPTAAGRAVLWCVLNGSGGTQALPIFFLFLIKLSFKGNFFVLFGCVFLRGSSIY